MSEYWPTVQTVHADELTKRQEAALVAFEGYRGEGRPCEDGSRSPHGVTRKTIKALLNKGLLKKVLNAAGTAYDYGLTNGGRIFLMDIVGAKDE